MKTGDELVKSYKINGRTIDVYGCWDSETPEGKFDFYDLYETQGRFAECLNVGNPFWEMPSKDDVEEFLETAG